MSCFQQQFVLFFCCRESSQCVGSSPFVNNYSDVHLIPEFLYRPVFSCFLSTCGCLAAIVLPISSAPSALTELSHALDSPVDHSATDQHKWNLVLEEMWYRTVTWILWWMIRVAVVEPGPQIQLRSQDRLNMMGNQMGSSQVQIAVDFLHMFRGSHICDRCCGILNGMHAWIQARSGFRFWFLMWSGVSFSIQSHQVHGCHYGVSTYLAWKQIAYCRVMVKNMFSKSHTLLHER